MERIFMELSGGDLPGLHDSNAIAIPPRRYPHQSLEKKAEITNAVVSDPHAYFGNVEVQVLQDYPVHIS
jgi:hypothetical protein